VIAGDRAPGQAQMRGRTRSSTIWSGGDGTCGIGDEERDGCKPDHSGSLVVSSRPRHPLRTQRRLTSRSHPVRFPAHDAIDGTGSVFTASVRSIVATVSSSLRPKRSSAASPVLTARTLCGRPFAFYQIVSGRPGGPSEIGGGLRCGWGRITDSSIRTLVRMACSESTPSKDDFGPLPSSNPWATFEQIDLSTPGSAERRRST